MIDVAKLKGKIAEKGTSQVKLAKILNITPKTFYDKMKKGVFTNIEIEMLVKELDIKNPMEIFLQIKFLYTTQKFIKKARCKNGKFIMENT